MTNEEPGDGLPAELSFDEAMTILGTAVNPFVLMSMDGIVQWASASVEELLGYSSEQMAGMQMLELVAPESHHEALEAMADAVEPRLEESYPSGWEGVGPVYTLLRADGIRVSCAVAVATSGRTGLDHLVLQLRRADATAALERLHLAMGTSAPLDEILRHVAAVLEGELPAADVILYHFDRDNQRLQPTATGPGLADRHDLPSLLGDRWSEAEAAPGEVVGVAVEDLPPQLQVIAENAGYRWVLLSSIERLTDSEERPAMVTVWSKAPYRPHRLNHERVTRCGRLLGVSLQADWGREALLWAATHDLLTGLPNQAAFNAALDEARSGHRRSDRASVLYLDLDDFKPVNEAFGHLLGNRVLVRIAERLRSLVRPTDMVARLGGDEFAILCRGMDEEDALARLAQRLVEEVRQPIELDGHVVEVGLSVGIATSRGDDGIDTVLTRADNALRQAKREGKSRWRVAG